MHSVYALAGAGAGGTGGDVREYTEPTERFLPKDRRRSNAKSTHEFKRLYSVKRGGKNRRVSQAGVITHKSLLSIELFYRTNDL
jgi:hypothetical protein